MGDESLERALGRVEGKLDQILQTLDTLHAENAQQSARIESLEHTRTKQNTVIGMIVLACTALGGVIGKYLHA